MQKKIIYFLLILNSLFFINKSIAQNCTVNAGIDKNICQNQQITLDGNSQGLISIPAKWSQISGPTTIIDNPNNLSSDVSGYSSGIFKYRIAATCQDGQYVYDEVTFTINPITTANAGNDIESCPGIENLNGNSPGIGETAQWSIESSNNAGISFSDILDPNSSITLDDNVQGTTTVRWTISNASCSSFSEINITNYGGQTPVTAGSDQTLGNCYTISQSTVLNASIGGNGTGDQIGTWTLVSGPNYPTFGNIHSNSSSISNLIEGTYTLRWTVEGPCVNGSDEMMITVPAATQNVSDANAGNNIRFCNGSTSAVLSGSYPEYADETVTWTQTGGPTTGISITNPNDPSTSVTGLDGSSVYTFMYTIENATYGCTNVDYVNIRYSSPASINITDGDFLNSCSDTSVTIHYTVSGGTTTDYRIISGPYTTNWARAGSTSQKIDFTKSGTYVVQFQRYATGTECGNAFDQITITISKKTSKSNAGTDQILACNIIETDLAGNEPTYGTGFWTQINGPNSATFDDQYDKSSHISGLIEGEYNFRWTISAGPSCPPESDDVKVVVSTPTTSTTAAGADQNICGNSIIYLDGQAPAENETGSWSVNPSAGLIFSSINDPKATVIGLEQNTTYEFIWRVESACAWSSDTVYVTTNSTVGPSIADAGPNQCEPDGTLSVTMAGNTPTEGIGTWSVISGPNSPTIDNINNNNTNVNNLTNGTYAFEWAISKVGCQTTRDTVWVTASPTASTSDAGLDITVCGTSSNLAATTPVIGTGTWKQVSGNAGVILSNSLSPTSSITNLSDGTYSFQWSVSVGVCPTTLDTTNVFVNTPPTSADAGLDQDVCSITNTTLDANIPLNGYGFWSLADNSENSPSITNLSDPKSTISNLVTGQYHLVWNIQSGHFCDISQDTVIISVSAPANAGTDKQLCNSSEILLSGTDGSSGIWTEISALGATISQISNYSAIASNLVIEGDYTFRYTVPAIYSCPSTFNEVLIQTSPYGEQPNAGLDQEICTSGGNSTILDATTPSVGTGQWIVLSAPNTPSFTDNTEPKTTISNLVQGLYILEWNVTYNWCANYSDVVRINVYDPPTTAVAGTDQTTACVLNTQLEANAVSNGIGEWSLVAGPGTISIDNPNLPNTTISNPSASGTYSLRWTTTNGTVCAASTDDVDITFGSVIQPDAPDAGIDKYICENSSVQMTANTITNGTGTWSQFSGPVVANISNPNSPIADITNLLNDGNYLFVWTSSEGFCQLSDTVLISIDTLITSNAGNDNVFCDLQSIELDANNPTPGTGTWSLVSGPTSVIFEDENLYNSKVAGTSLGNYIFKWTIDNGACSNESNVNIDVVTIPVDDLVVSGESLCYASDATVTINNAEAGFTYYAYIGTTLITQGIGTGTDLDINIPWDKLSIGDNYFTFVADNGSCSSTLLNQALVHVDACADLELTKEVNDTLKHVGANVDFTISVTNHGPSDATNTIVNDLIPSGYTYVSDNSGGDYNSGTGIWTIGNLLNGNSTSIIITATVNLTGIYENIADVSSNEVDINLTNNEDTATVEAVPYSDLVIVKSIDNSTPDVGSNIVFTLTVTNNGPNDAPNVQVIDTLPSGYSYVSDDGAGDYNTSTNIWTIGNLANMATAVLKITATVNASGEYKNIAFVSGEVIEPDSTNNVDSITPVPIPVCDLEVEKIVDISNPYVGTDVKFSISVTNKGPSDATNVSVIDNLPSGFTYVSDNSGGSYNPLTGIWTIGDMLNSASVSLDIIATVNVSGDYTNSAVVTGDQIDRIPTNDSSAITINPVPSADLEIIKTANFVEEYVNDNIIFTLFVINNGPSTATNVEVTDLLPSGFTYISDNSKGDYNASNGIWSIGTLNANDSTSINITVKINLEGDYLNTATVEGDEYDPDENNNYDEEEIKVIRTILVPEGFSPNGDGINDYLRIKALEDYPNNKLKIINRWGNLIYISAPYLNDWDGTTKNGKSLPEGTYFYIIDLNDGTKPHKGYVYLKR